LHSGDFPLIGYRDIKKNWHIENWFAIEPAVMRLFGGDRVIAGAWLTTPAIGLDMQSPMDLLAAGNLQLIQDYLIRLEYGVYT